MDIRINGGFWHDLKELNRNVTIGSIYDRFAETGRFSALKCGWKPGMENKPHIFYDSDTESPRSGLSARDGGSLSPEAGTLSSEADALASEADARRVSALEAKVDEMVADIVRNQREDGYFNSYFLTCEPEGIFQKRYNHELYCARCSSLKKVLPLRRPVMKSSSLRS